MGIYVMAFVNMLVGIAIGIYALRAVHKQQEKFVEGYNLGYGQARAVYKTEKEEYDREIREEERAYRASLEAKAKADWDTTIARMNEEEAKRVPEEVLLAHGVTHESQLPKDVRDVFNLGGE